MTAYILSQIRGRPRRTLAVVAGVALGAGLFVALTALGSGFREAARAPLDDVAADLVVTRPTGSDEPDAAEQRTRGVRTPFGLATLGGADIDVIVRTPGVADASAALQVWDFGPRTSTTIVGLDPREAAVGPGRALTRELVEGRAFSSSERGVAVADLHYARFYGLVTGSSVTVGDRQFEIVGVVELADTSQTAAANLYVPLPDAQALAGLAGDEVNQVYVMVEAASDIQAITQRLDEQLGGISAISEDSLVQIMGGVGRVSARFSGVAAVVGLLGGLLLGGLALQSLVTERRREIGVMKAVGWSARDVARVFRREAFVLSVIGALVGVLFGLASTALLARLPLPQSTIGIGQEVSAHQDSASAVGELPITTTLPARADPAIIAVAVLTTTAGGTLVGWNSARRAAALKPGRTLASL
ncbi:MAG: ABC transporter permease [Egibacteraceae bacterium]